MGTQQHKHTDMQHRRIQGGRLIEQGFRNAEIVKILRCSLSSVKRWRKTIDAEGLDGLNRQVGSGRKPKLGAKQLARLKRLLQKGATKFGYANAIWTSRRVARLILETFCVTYSMRQTRRILRKIGYSPQKPVKRSRKYSAEAVRHFRRHKWPHIKKVP